MPRTNSPPRHCDPRPLAEISISRDKNSKQAKQSLTVNLAESPLAWLHKRALINDRHLQAGEILRSDYERAALGPRVTMRWENVPKTKIRRAAPAPMNQTEQMIFAKDRFDNAMAALGPDLDDIAWRVICACEAMPNAEREMGWPARSGKLVLRIALDRLAAHYRLPEITCAA
jgi:hypothetical protein